MHTRWKYLTYLSTFTVSQSGDWLFSFVIVVLIKNATQSESSELFVFSFLGFLQGIASLIGGTTAPSLIQRRNLNSSIIGINIFLAAISAAIAILSSIPHFIIVLIVLCTIKSYFTAFYQCVDNQMRTVIFDCPVKLVTFNRTRGLLSNLARAVVYPSSAFLMSKLGENNLLFWDAISFLLVACIFHTLIKLNEVRNEKSSSLSMWKNGTVYYAKNKEWLHLLFAYCVPAMICSINFTLSPVMVNSISKNPSESIAWILGAGGLGGVIGSTKRFHNYISRYSILIPVGCLGIGSILLPLSSSVTMVAVLYFFNVLITIPFFTKIESLFNTVPKEHSESFYGMLSIMLNFVIPTSRLCFVLFANKVLGLNCIVIMLTSSAILFATSLIHYSFFKNNINKIYARNL